MPMGFGGFFVGTSDLFELRFRKLGVCDWEEQGSDDYFSRSAGK
jgi:hypothetical protein